MTKIQQSEVQVRPVNEKPALESTGIFLGIIVSALVIVNASINLISKFNKLSSNVENIQEDLQTTVKEFTEVVKRSQNLDKNLDLHISDYIHHKELTQMLVNQLNEKIDHKFNRLTGSIKHIEKFLENSGSFRSSEHSDK